MKKVLTILVAVLLLIAVSVIWIWRHMGVSDAALLLPSDTVALVSLPDLPRSAFRWPNTTLAKIGVEPEMKAFLEKPFQYLTKNQGGDEAGSILWDLKPGRIFAAVTSVSSKEVGLLVGFQFWGSKNSQESAVARLRNELAKDGKTVELTREVYEGTEITSSVHPAFTLYSASHGQWGFLSNNIASLKDALDRAAGRKKEGHLADSQRYREVIGELSKDPDFLVFVQPQTALDTITTIGQAMGAQVNPVQLEQARKVEAIGAATKLDGADLRDTIFVLRQNPPDIGSLTHGPMKFTSGMTIAYFGFLLDFSQYADAAANPAVASLLASRGIQDLSLLKLLPEAFGPECAVNISWPGEKMKPEALLAVQIKDQAKAEQALMTVLAFFPETTVTDDGPYRFYNFRALQTALANPTITMVDGYLLIGIDPDDLKQAVSAIKNNHPIDKSPAFASALPAYKAANEVFGYIDAKTIFDRGFPLLRPVFIFSTAFMPGASDVIDSSKLPQTETISKHLKPIVYAQTRKSNGYLIESSGPITMNQVVLIGASTGASFFKPTGNQ